MAPHVRGRPLQHLWGNISTPADRLRTTAPRRPSCIEAAAAHPVSARGSEARTRIHLDLADAYWSIGTTRPYLKPLEAVGPRPA